MFVDHTRGPYGASLFDLCHYIVLSPELQTQDNKREEDTCAIGGQFRTRRQEIAYAKS